jgi:DNA-3-methyladenine glycosylase
LRKPIEKIPTVPDRLTRASFEGATESVAKWLLGKALVCKQGRSSLGGIIVETEAYLKKGDPASHSFRGQTPRNAAMFLRAGMLYVYSIHAKYCLNVSTENDGEGCAVLIRAIEPVWGRKKMAACRGREIENQRQVVELTNGPAKICQALGMGLIHNGANLSADASSNEANIWVGNVKEITVGPDQIVASPRIGISKAVDRKLRFFVDRNRFVSGRKSLHTGKADQSFFRINALSK